MSEVIKVGMADLNVCTAPDGLTTLGLGSCVGIALRDPVLKVGGLAHIMLPDSTAIRGGSSNIPKFADTGIEELVRRMEERLKSIKIDAMLSPSSVEEYVTGSRWTTFPLLQYTERADRFCQGLLNGRVGLVVDGLPLGYLAPVNLGYLMDSPEDRSRDFISASCIRILRYSALMLSLLLPAVYIALITFHPQYVPDSQPELRFWDC